MMLLSKKNGFLLLLFIFLTTFVSSQVVVPTSFPVYPRYIISLTSPLHTLTDAVATADFTGDGVLDILIGHPIATGGGEFFIYDGLTGLLFYSSPVFNVTDFGATVVVIGDLNNDSHPEFAIGAPQSNIVVPFGTTLPSIPSVYIFDGNSMAQLNAISSSVFNPMFSEFGRSLSSLEDISGDLLPELVIGSYQGVVVYSLSYSGPQNISATLIRQYISPPSSASLSTFGFSVSSAGDVNLDGYADILVGDPTATNNNLGKAYVLSGASDLATPIFNFSVSSVGFGFSVFGNFDYDGDYYPDFLIGAPGDFFTPGRIFVFSGVNGTLLTQFGGNVAGDQFGYSVVAGDLNGDNYVEVVGSSIGSSNNGRVEAYNSQTGVLLHNWTRRNYNYGSNLAIGDISGDDINELLILSSFPSIYSANNFLDVESLGGVSHYGFGSSSNLFLDWIPNLLYPRTGMLQISGGTSGNQGYLFVSNAPASFVYQGQMINIDMNNLFLSQPIQFSFNQNGIGFIGPYDYSNPLFAGNEIYLQVGEMTSGILKTSNSIAARILPS